MTFLELCQTTRQECSIQGTGPSSVESQTGLLKKIVDWVAKADYRVQSLHADWDFLWTLHEENTNIGVDTIVKPTDYGLWDRESFQLDRGTSNGTTLSFVPYLEWRANPSLKENAKPSQITVLPSGSLSFQAPADAIYSFSGYYWKTPTKLTGNSDESAIPERFQDIIIARAKMFFFDDIESYDQYTLAKDEYKELLLSLEQFALPSNLVSGQTSPEQIIVRPV